MAMTESVQFGFDSLRSVPDGSANYFLHGGFPLCLSVLKTGERENALTVDLCFQPDRSVLQCTSLGQWG